MPSNSAMDKLSFIDDVNQLSTHPFFGGIPVAKCCHVLLPEDIQEP